MSVSSDTIQSTVSYQKDLSPMENTWMIIVVLLMVAIGLFYAGFKDEHPRTPLGWSRKIVGAFFATVGSIFFGLFGFNLALFEEENGGVTSSEKE